MGGRATCLQELRVYQLANRVAERVFELSRRFPDDELYELTSQIRRASRSVGAQIAEAWGRRRYRKHFVSKLTDARAEAFETEHWVEIARSGDLISQEAADELRQELTELDYMLRATIGKAHLFCRRDPKPPLPRP